MAGSAVDLDGPVAAVGPVELQGHAKAEIHRILRGLADAGLSILLISSELPGVLGISERLRPWR